MTSPRYGSLRARTECNHCGSPLPFDAPMLEVSCAQCSGRVSVPAGTWGAMLTDLDEKLELLAEGQGHTANTVIEGQKLVYEVRREMPHCEKCGALLEIADWPVGTSRNFACTQCGDPASTEPSPSWLGSAGPGPGMRRAWIRAARCWALTSWLVCWSCEWRMAFWSRLFTGRRGSSGNGEGTPVKGASSSPKAHWREPDDPGNPFGVRLLDLMENLGMLSVTEDPALAERAVSWKPGTHRRVDLEVSGTTHSCDLRYPVGPELAEGLLYRPREMEDKWVIAYRDGHVAAARSWTGKTVASARACHEQRTLRLSELTLDAASGLDVLGDPILAFDWLIRSHALGARIPFPVSVEGASLLVAAPLTGFSLHGRQLFCAATDFEPGEPRRELGSDGDLVAAVCKGDAKAMAAALSDGAPVNARTTFSHGAPVLNLAVQLHPELVEPLLAAGADARATCNKGSTALMAAAAANAERTVFDWLIAAGANPEAVDELGFTAVHVAAQFGHVEALATLRGRGARLTPCNEAGVIPLHVAAGNGRRAAVEWFLDQGVDPRAPSPMGDPASIAEAEGHAELADWLRLRQK